MRPDVVVVGPSRSGVGSLVEALRARLPRHSVEEKLGGDDAAVVVFVVSAAAPVTRSDMDLLDAAAFGTAAVVAAVAKIDVHRTWRQVLAANRTALAAHRERYRSATWTGVAARPEIGPPVLDELVEVLLPLLGRADIAERNRVQREAAARGRRAVELRRRQRDRTARAIALRGRIHRARMQLGGQARGMAATLRTELAEAAAAVTPRQSAAFRRDAARRVAQLADELDRAVTRRLDDVAAESGLRSVDDGMPPDPPVEIVLPSFRHSALENRLTALLGAGFGVGAGRLVAGLLEGGAPVVVAACLSVGAGLGWWVSRARRVLSERAALDRWGAEVSARLRTALEERVAARVLAAETALNLAALQPSDRFDNTVAS